MVKLLSRVIIEGRNLLAEDLEMVLLRGSFNHGGVPCQSPKVRLI